METVIVHSVVLAQVGENARVDLQVGLAVVGFSVYSVILKIQIQRPRSFCWVIATDVDVDYSVLKGEFSLELGACQSVLAYFSMRVTVLQVASYYLCLTRLPATDFA